MARVVTSSLFEVTPEEDNGEAEGNLSRGQTMGGNNRHYTHDAVIQSISNPQPELRSCEECVLLTKHVELGISVEDACRNELIEYTDDEGR